MGCDIHCYIEYSSDSRYWISFGGCINPGRNYAIFAKLAGVRNDEPKVVPPIPPRGVPPDAGFSVEYDNALLLIEDNEPDDERTVKKSTAKSWYGDSGPGYLCRDGQPYAVYRPDWHSHSWMTPNEFGSTLKEELDTEPVYYTMLATMRALEHRGLKSRLIFWFDN